MAEAGYRWPRPVGRSKAHLVSHLPLAEDWYPIEQAIRGGWSVMLVWDRDTREWRCDFIQPGTIWSGAGLWVGQAAEDAWRAAREG